MKLITNAKRVLTIAGGQANNLVQLEFSDEGIKKEEIKISYDGTAISVDLRELLRIGQFFAYQNNLQMQK